MMFSSGLGNWIDSGAIHHDKNKGQRMGLGLGGEDYFSFHIVSEVPVGFCSEYIEFKVDIQ